jgi:hypothetical protein
MRHTVDFLYTLYDALVSINVPSDKARAVVDAMERDMATTLATRQDLQQIRQEMRGLATRDELQQIRHEMKAFATKEDFLLVKQDLQLLGQRLDGQRTELTKDIEAMHLRLTARLGAMMVVGMGLLFAAIRIIWPGRDRVAQGRGSVR